MNIQAFVEDVTISVETGDACSKLKATMKKGAVREWVINHHFIEESLESVMHGIDLLEQGDMLDTDITPNDKLLCRDLSLMLHAGPSQTITKAYGINILCSHHAEGGARFDMRTDDRKDDEVLFVNTSGGVWDFSNVFDAVCRIVGNINRRNKQANADTVDKWRRVRDLVRRIAGVLEIKETTP